MYYYFQKKILFILNKVVVAVVDFLNYIIIKIEIHFLIIKRKEAILFESKTIKILIFSSFLLLLLIITQQMT
jgi:hypothetical protein